MSFLKYFFKYRKTPKVYALVGRSGTGKSYRAQFIAQKYRISLIIDDGLLIKNDKILAGKSAKQENNFLSAVKCAVFSNQDHRNQILKVLSTEKFRKILIIGTSEKMAQKITEVLNLPYPEVILHIEDIATKDEIDTALQIRYNEGKHIIPVSPIQITRFYPAIVYDSIISTISRKLSFGKRKIKKEKTLVKPEFSKPTETAITENTLKQMINQCLYAYGKDLKIEEFNYTEVFQRYVINITLRTPIRLTHNEENELKDFISDSIEKYGDIRINNLNLSFNVWDL